MVSREKRVVQFNSQPSTTSFLQVLFSSCIIEPVGKTWVAERVIHNMNKDTLMGKWVIQTLLQESTVSSYVSMGWDRINNSNPK